MNITSYDGLTLCGTEFIQSQNNNKYAIIVHGYGKNQSCMNDIAQNYYMRGFTPITIDLKAHGKSEGKYIGMGWNDRKDIILWINKILEMDNNCQIVLHGVSMGASTIMMAIGENLPDNVKAIIEDCGYTSAWEVFKLELKARFNLPSFPILNSANLFTKFCAGYNIKDVSALSQVSKSETPILFIHGRDDNFIPVDMAYELYNATNVKKDLFIVDGAGHNECRFLNESDYYNVVFNFINDIID